MKFRYKMIFIFILLGLLFQGGCGLFKVYDIQGAWRIEKTVNGEKTTLLAEFTGSGDYGNVFVDDITLGEYVVYYDDDLVFSISYFEPGALTTDRKDTFSGGFDGKNNMTGTVEVVDVDDGINQTGEWTAVKQSPEF
ncbi:MAG: hypothetical protein NT166_26680 [Candidatus Aminicenantes bacterium]|nr:hypothetical protein [Candidatus Aminicenantes bacterium]